MRVQTKFKKRGPCTAALAAAALLVTTAPVHAQDLVDDCFDCGGTVHTVDGALAIEKPDGTQPVESVMIIGSATNETSPEGQSLIGITPLLPKMDLAAHRLHGWTAGATYRVSGIYNVPADQAGEHAFVFSAQDYQGSSTCSVTARTSEYEITQISLANIGANKLSQSINLAFEEGAYRLGFDMSCNEGATVSMDIRVVKPGTTERRPPDFQQFVIRDPISNFVVWSPDDRAQVQSIQTGLNALGFGAGPADGLIGRLTRNAVSSFAEATEVELKMGDHTTVIEKIEQARRNELYVSYNTESAFIGRPFSNRLRQRLARYSLAPIKETFDRLMAVSDAAPGTNLSWSINSQTYGHITLLDTYKDCVFTEQSITVRDHNEFGRYYVCRDLSEQWTLAKQKPAAAGVSSSGS